MYSFGSPIRAGIVAFAGLAATFCVTESASAQTYITADQGFTFTYPQRWQAAEANGAIKITASDGSVYSLKLDTIETAVTAGSPVNDSGLKQAAAKIAAPLASGATFVKASPISMDHGQGASFRFKSSSGENVDVWMGMIGKHTAVLTPAKAGQTGQTIGLSVIFQTMAFIDSLPKQAPVQRQKPEMTPTTSGSSLTTTRTVLYSRQIAPILTQRCLACHSSQSASGGLNVSNYSAFLSGGSRGSIIKPGNAAGSALIDYLTGARDQMPKGSAPLTAAQIDLFRTWIREGASNDLDPGSIGTASTVTSGTSAAAPAAPGNTVRKNNSARAGFGRSTVVGSGMPKPMESYSGHLASNDTSFDMKLYTNGTVTAAWAFDQPSPARFQGTYTISAGVYNIRMDLASGSIPGASKTLKLIMQATGTDVVGKFSLDTSAPKYKIIGLQLAEIDNASKNPNTTGAAAGTGTAGRRNRKQ
jgi:hypothetical protein